MSLTVISLLCIRKSVAELHIKSVKRYINPKHHYIYLPFELDYINELKNKFPKVKFFTKNDVKWKRNDNIPDSTYGLMLKEVETKNFLFLHDDTIITEKFNLKKFTSYFEKYDFFGLIDDVAGRVKNSAYRNVYYGNETISNLRIGTFFMAGNKSMFLKNNLSTGNMKYLFPFFTSIYYNLPKLSVKKIVEFDGGFDFNIKILNNKKYNVKRCKKLSGVIHLERFANFFKSRNIDSSKVDLEIWKNRDKSYKKYNPKNEYKYLINIAKKLENFDVEDNFLNTKVLDTYYKKSNH